MDLNTYQERASATAIYPGRYSPLGLIYCVLKLAGESGEVAEKVGKALRDEAVAYPATVDGQPVMAVDRIACDNYHSGITSARRADLKKELGDVLWYVSQAASELGYNLSDIAKENLDKLADRQSRGVLQGSGDNR